MNIPTFVAVKFVDDNGYLTSEMQLYNDELNRALIGGLSDNGWTLPAITVTTMAEIIALTGDRIPPDGSMWYVFDDAPVPTVFEFVVKINGAYRKVSTTAYP
jgi:hypothetical protein